MKKKSLLCTTLAGTMIVAGMTFPAVNASTNKIVVNETEKVVVVELPSGQATLSKVAFEEMVKTEYANKKITVTPTLSGDIVKTGASVKITDSLSLDVVLLGDVNQDGEVDVLDAQRITKKSIKGESFDRLEKMAANINGDDDSDIYDAQRIKNFTMKPERYAADGYAVSSSLPDEVINQSIGAKVKVETEYTGAKGLWDVVPNSTNTQVTLKVVADSGNTSFGLTGVPAGTEVDSSSSTGISLSTITDGKTNVTVPRKAGVYTLTLKADNGSQTITINVEDVTLANNANVTFEEIQEEDINKISDSNVRANTQEVYENNPSFGSNTIEFSGNVNNMKGNKTYKARIKVDEMANSNVVVAYVQGNEVKRITPEVVDGTTNTIIVELDATLAETKLVVAPKEAVDAQIKAEVAKTNGNCEIVKFNSTSKMQVRSISKTNAQNKNSNSEVLEVQEDSTNKNFATLAVDFNNLKEFNLKKTDFTISSSTGENVEKAKWECICLQLFEDKPNSADLATTLTIEDSNNILLDTQTKLNDSDVGKKIRLWFKVDKEEIKKCTLVYHETNGYEEKLTLTLNIKNSATPIIESTTEGTKNKAVIVAEKPDNTDTNVYKINTTTYKYAMTESVPTAEQVAQGAVDDQEGRWYSIILKTNVPVKNLQYTLDTKYVDIPEENIINDYECIIWIDRDTVAKDSDSELDSLKLQNKYAKTPIPITVKLHQLEKSVTEILTGNSQPIYNKSLNQNASDLAGKLVNVNVKENVHDKEFEKLEEEFAQAEKKKHTLANNIVASYNSTLSANQYDSEKDTYTATMTVNTNNFGDIEVNGKVGKWALLHFAVRGEINKIIDENNDNETVYIDIANSDKLLEANGGNVISGGWYRVPVWVNLTSNAVQDAIENETAITVSFGSTNPVEEHNSFMLKFVDTKPEMKVELDEVKQNPKVYDTTDYEDLNESNLQEKINEVFEPGTVSSPKDAKHFLNNMEIMENAEITSQIIDNAVYVNVKANLKGLEQLEGSDQVIKVPLKFDLTALGTKKNDEISLWRAATKKFVHGKQDLDNGITLKIRYKDREVDAYDDIKKGLKVTEEFIFTKGSLNDSSIESLDAALSKVTGSYIRYVVTFEQAE